MRLGLFRQQCVKAETEPTEANCRIQLDFNKVLLDM